MVDGVFADNPQQFSGVLTDRIFAEFRAALTQSPLFDAATIASLSALASAGSPTHTQLEVALRGGESPR